MPFVDWKCPECNREIRIDGSLKSCYCNACGKKIRITSSTSSKDETINSSLVDWRCPECDREIRVDRSLDSCFCNVCGKKIALTQKENDEPSAIGKSASNPWTKGTCPSCGESVCALEDKAIPCPYCGLPIDAESITETDSVCRASTKPMLELDPDKSKQGPAHHKTKTIRAKSAAAKAAEREKGKAGKPTSGRKSGTADGPPSEEPDSHGGQKAHGTYASTTWCKAADGSAKNARADSQPASGRKSGTSSSLPAQKAKSSTAKAEAPGSKTPFLDGWKTSVGMFILGLLCSYALGFAAYFGTVALLVVAVALFFGIFFWCVGVYPSLFTNHPDMKSNGAVSFFNAFFGGIIFGALWNSSLTNKRKGVSQNVFVVMMLAMFVSVGALYVIGQSGGQPLSFLTGSATSSASSSKQAGGTSKSSAGTTSNAGQNNTTNNGGQNNTTNTRTYEDSRWPTYSSELLAIPESERWYNAEGSLGTTCTITGPVKRVYENQDTAGNTVTVIEMGTGSSFRGSRPVSLVIWPWDIDALGETIDYCRKGNAWLTVTGYLYQDGDYYMFASTNGVECMARGGFRP